MPGDGGDAIAQLRLDEIGKRISFSAGILHGLAAFFRTYVFRAGFLDGRRGLLLAVANAEGTFYKYMKAWRKGQSAAQHPSTPSRPGGDPAA